MVELVKDYAMRVRPRYWLGGLVLIGFVVLGISALEQTSVQYVSIAEALRTGKRVQIKGTWVREMEPVYDTRANVFRFVLQDERGDRISVVYAGAKPNNFELAESVVVRGSAVGGEFQAVQILTKCPSKYEGSAPGPQ
ncbi:MAG: cytochrome c maturation protein CcmE [Candidatus Kapabacteria bacterium]|nr:cytochrome c maturation protein CcmE [Candidatus Kapabacteria bacterium]MCS7170194.1 cytochrome c maturation protein CcmE [Candidatus Kapabacteria bacterium]MDW7997008.1 cytochrome c maturation protein CcmE [Bacteroidota bacterium]MDW8224666.1 cytochrome c maturation protein CcmE [Bacteroidota bacterium]